LILDDGLLYPDDEPQPRPRAVGRAGAAGLETRSRGSTSPVAARGRLRSWNSDRPGCQPGGFVRVAPPGGSRRVLNWVGNATAEIPLPTYADSKRTWDARSIAWPLGE